MINTVTHNSNWLCAQVTVPYILNISIPVVIINNSIYLIWTFHQLTFITLRVAGSLNTITHCTHTKSMKLTVTCLLNCNFGLKFLIDGSLIMIAVLLFIYKLVIFSFNLKEILVFYKNLSFLVEFDTNICFYISRSWEIVYYIYFDRNTCLLQEFEILSPQEDLLLLMRGGPYDLEVRKLQNYV